jgi:hypothetical protein
MKIHMIKYKSINHIKENTLNNVLYDKNYPKMFSNVVTY